MEPITSSQDHKTGPRMQHFVATFRRSVSFTVEVDQVCTVLIKAPDARVAQDAAWRIADYDEIEEWGTEWIEEGDRVASDNHIEARPRPERIETLATPVRKRQAIADACAVLGLDPRDFESSD